MKFGIELDTLTPQRGDSELNATYGDGKSTSCSFSLPREIAGQRPRYPGIGGGGAEDGKTKMTDTEDAPRTAQHEAEAVIKCRTDMSSTPEHAVNEIRN